MEEKSGKKMEEKESDGSINGFESLHRLLVANLQPKVFQEASRLLLGLNCGRPLEKISLPEAAASLSGKHYFDKQKTTKVKKAKDDNYAKREHLNWTFQMDKAFVQSMLTQHYAGNRVDGTFTSKAYGNMVNELTTKLGISFTKNHLKNRLKTIKEHFSLSYDMYRGIKFSGFAWNSETKVFETTEEVWQTLIEENPDYAKWRTKKVYNFQDLMELFGKDRATCIVAQTTKERNNQMANTNNINVETINKVDQLLSANEVILENFDDDVQMISPMESPQVPTQNVSSSKDRKRKHDQDDISLKLMSSIDNVTEAIRECSTILKERNIILERSRQRVYTEEEIWSELEVIGLEPSSVLRGAYLFLVNHPGKVRALFGCPFKMRKSILEDMMHQSV